MNARLAIMFCVLLGISVGQLRKGSDLQMHMRFYRTLTVIWSTTLTKLSSWISDRCSPSACSSVAVTRQELRQLPNKKASDIDILGNASPDSNGLAGRTECFFTETGLQV